PSSSTRRPARASGAGTGGTAGDRGTRTGAGQAETARTPWRASASPLALACYAEHKGIVVELWTLIIATVSGTGVTMAAQRARRARARRLALRRRLEQIHVDLPLDVRHLTPDLGRLAIQARVVRLVLETPLHRVFEAPLRQTPWGRRERCDDYDLAVGEARRALWEWLGAVRRLRGADRALLAELGLWGAQGGMQRLWALLRQPGVFERTDDVFEETLFPVAPDP